MKACYRDRVSFPSCRGQCVVTSETVDVIGYSCNSTLQCAQYLAAYSYTVLHIIPVTPILMAAAS